MLDVSRDLERIRDYLAGRLSDQESEAFGDRLVRDPQLVRELERTLGLSEGLRMVAREPRAAAVTPRRARPLWPALAAAAAVGVLAVALWLQPTVERTPLVAGVLTSGLSRAAAATVAAQFTFVATRGGTTPALELPRAGLVEFRAAAPPGRPAGGFRVTLLLTGDTPQALGAATVSAPQADGYLHVYADAARLQPGRYVLNVRGADATATLGAYPFTLGRDRTP